MSVPLTASHLESAEDVCNLARLGVYQSQTSHKGIS